MTNIRSTNLNYMHLIEKNKRCQVKSINHELYELMVFCEAEEPALMLRHRAHHNGTEKVLKLIDIHQNLSMNKKKILSISINGTE